jgi:hypothetical protein
MAENIDDLRPVEEFKVYTFSNYKHTDVRKQFQESLCATRIETACYWSAEMLCSGYADEIWDMLLQYYCKYINVGNVKIIILLAKRLEFFRYKMKSVVHSELEIRNEQSIRELIAELVTILCVSKKRIMLQRVDIKKESFDILRMNEIVKATSIIFEKKEEDSIEIVVPVNELYHSMACKNTHQSFYWIEWLLEYESRCNKNKHGVLKLERRDQFIKELRFQKHMVWIIWECFTHFIKKHALLQSCLDLFLFDYSKSTPKKRIFLLYFVVCLHTESYEINDKIVENLELLNSVKENIGNVYKPIKKHERFQSSNVCNTNNSYEKTLFKLTKMNHFSEKFVPRLDALESDQHAV